jgi:hypothetical protein
MWGQSWLEFSVLTDGFLGAGCPLPTITRPVCRDRRRNLAESNLRCRESIYPTTQSFGPAMPQGHPCCHQITSQLEIPIFARTRLSPLTLAVTHARLRERASGMWQCSTDHQAGQRIMGQDLWTLQGHGQCDPPRTPPQVLVRNIVCDIVRYLRTFCRYRCVISYNGDIAYNIAGQNIV